MNFKSYGPRMAVFLIAASVILIAAAGATWAEASDDVRGADRDRVAAATDVDDDDDNDDEDGDDDAKAVLPDNDDNPHVTRSDDVDSDDRPLTKAEKLKVTTAAAKAVGSGTVTDAEASDDLGTAFEAEVRDRNGVEWDVELNVAYDVVSKTKDD